MAPKRLSETEKQQIAERYRQPAESTSTLARAFGVSTSTIGRVLKSSFSTEEYETLVRQKRSLGRGGGKPTEQPVETPTEQPTKKTTEKPILKAAKKAADLDSGSEAADSGSDSAPPAAGKAARRTRTRRRTKAERDTANTEPAATDDAQLDLSLTGETADPPLVVAIKSGDASSENGRTRRRRRRSASSRKSEEAADTASAPIEVETLEPEDEKSSSRRRRSRRSSRSRSRQPEAEPAPPREVEAPLAESEPDASFDPVTFLIAPPLSEASLPKVCYLVVDRSSELIARPLQEFGELGEIPAGEEREQTLPVFDNHRVARRFANRTQRVMKIPDSRVLQKTGSHLQAKGITRLLIDGKLYSL
ncbi:MAG: hypothetical protein ACFB9N_04320 [Geitlerinemataceae cyanobacterium]